MGIQDIVSQMGGQQGAMDQMQDLFGGKGIQGIVSRMTQAGMGQQVQSWIGKGDNQSISGQQIKQAVDPAALQRMSQKTGMEPTRSVTMPRRCCRTSWTRPRRRGKCRPGRAPCPVARTP